MTSKRARKSHKRGGRLVLILGDQLSPDMTSLTACDPAHDTVLMVEVAEETRYVRHHKKKIAFLLSAMRHFATELTQQGWHVVYRTLAETGAEGSFTSEVARAVAETGACEVVVTEPGEWRVLAMIKSWDSSLGVPVRVMQDRRFLCSQAEFAAWAQGRRQLRMEFFYREMRRKTGLLMEGDAPAGGKWNFDHDNRKPGRANLFMPEPLRVDPDKVTQEVLALVAARFGDHFGDLEPFWFGVTRAGAEAARDHFIGHALPRFGDFQDAMLEGQRFLYHSVLSLYLNCGLLDPLDLCRRVAEEWRAGRVPLNAAEGFIRQIIGWREFVRGIYWLRMPGYAEENSLGATRPLPWFYWSAETDLACLKAALTQTKEEAYAHHIQRLMLTGNFALLAGIAPREVHEWYLAVYADAYEWVELPNTLGMSQFADGGLLGSKPYASSGAYINRMSDHCRGCRYDVKKRTGADACPFNALYWHFLARHRDEFVHNPRMAQMYRTLDRFPAREREEILAQAESFLSTLA